MSSGSMAAGTDVEGSADFPDIGRFEGSWITYYEARDFDEYRLATGPVKGRNGDGVALEGRVTRIAYKLDPGPSVLEVARNFAQTLAESGYETIFECDQDKCGGYDFRYYGTELVPEPHFIANLRDFRYIAAKKDGVHVAVLTSEHQGYVFTQVMAVESAEMENSMVDAKQMAQSISDTGKIAIYGILFDYDKSDIKEESRPALDQIAALMAANPGLQILIVGHTDNQGAMDYNVNLSMARARAIVAELTSAYGIDADRLTPAGAGFLAPVASNRNESGRAQNRRVELVER
jgi:outer membrane protein OmpA-like peptidoglycan-associated protein